MMNFYSLKLRKRLTRITQTLFSSIFGLAYYTLQCLATVDFHMLNCNYDEKSIYQDIRLSDERP
jgi:hypothetical protein